MTSAIEPHIKKYIDETVGTAVGIAAEEFQHRLNLMGELIDARIDKKLDEKFDERLAPFLKRSYIWEAEMKALRKDVNIHDRRISKLEHSRA